MPRLPHLRCLTRKKIGFYRSFRELRSRRMIKMGLFPLNLTAPGGAVALPRGEGNWVQQKGGMPRRQRWYRMVADFLPRRAAMAASEAVPRRASCFVGHRANLEFKTRIPSFARRTLTLSKVRPSLRATSRSGSLPRSAISSRDQERRRALNLGIFSLMRSTPTAPGVRPKRSARSSSEIFPSNRISSCE